MRGIWALFCVSPLLGHGLMNVRCLYMGLRVGGRMRYNLISYTESGYKSQNGTVDRYLRWATV